MKVTTMLLCGSVLAAVPLAAMAQNDNYNPNNDTGSYLELQIGRSHLYDHSFDVIGGRITTHSHDGDVVLLNSGYAFDEWGAGMLRVEGELGYRNNGVDSFTYTTTAGNSGTLADPGGHTQAWTLMFNVINDFSPHSAFDPYIGLGIGYARIDFHKYNAQLQLPGISTPTVTFMDDVDSGLAYQGMVGFRSWLSNTLALDVNWRYFKADSPTFNNGSGDVSSGYRMQSIQVGLAWQF
ncbi:MAG TPA: outer membrane beta-barrel protein [Gammaproteobacteria bacterium]|nr:outer membrane beta-barrel protein [Gammaproteobacteria bacterium]